MIANAACAHLELCVSVLRAQATPETRNSSHEIQDISIKPSVGQYLEWKLSESSMPAAIPLLQANAYYFLSKEREYPIIYVEITHVFSPLKHAF